MKSYEKRCQGSLEVNLIGLEMKVPTFNQLKLSLNIVNITY